MKKKKASSSVRRRRRQSFVNDFVLLSYVLNEHVKGTKFAHIAAQANEKFSLPYEMTREDPAFIIRWAAQRDMLVFNPPQDNDCRRKIRNLWPELGDVEVVHTTEVEPVALEGARMLVRMLRTFAGRETVTVGVAGGHTTRAVMRSLANELAGSPGDLPRTIHFRALASGFNPDQPSTNPNAFVTFFDTRLIPTQILFTGLSAPAIVSPPVFDQLREDEDIREAFAPVGDIDIFVTSGTSWHRHSVLWQRMGKKDQRVLERRRVVGDVLWRPIAESGPIEEETGRRAFTLLELRQLQALIEDQRKVLLTLAPCGLCGALKGELLCCILDQKLATHVCVDTRSARQVIGKRTQRPDPAAPS